MARGYPDRFGRPQFPKYGVMEFVDTLCWGEPLGETELYKKSGKGVLFYVDVRSWHGTFHGSNQVRVYIDGNLVMSPSFQKLLMFGPSSPISNGFFLECYDTLGGQYSMCFNGLVPFETELKVTYYNEFSVQTSVYYKVRYSLI